jgi:hypothetical protein
MHEVWRRRGQVSIERTVSRHPHAYERLMFAYAAMGRSAYFWYCSSLTCSIQSTGLPLSAS